jgi:signal transduction histidine kinase
MLGSRLFLKIFSSMILLIAVLSASVYLLTVPLIERETYKIELEASRTILDNVFNIVDKVAGSLEDHRAMTVDVVKAELKTVVNLASSYIETVYSQVARGEVTSEDARRLIADGLRTFRYGNNGYVWVVDYNSVFVSHPDSSVHGENASALRDERSGESIIPRIVEIARGQGAGFHEYSWSRLGSKNPAQKVSYFLDLPLHGLIVGTGAYLDDIDLAVEQRKRDAIEQLRFALSELRIAKTGYVFVFDGANNMVIHPNSNIEGTEISGRIEPSSKRPIGDVLKAAADTNSPASYSWDKPTDPGSYTYPKISWVRHFKGFNWYIASSVYADELQSSALALRDRIISVSVAILGVVSLLGSAAIWRLVEPLRKLSAVAQEIRTGNMDVASGIVRRDEIGTLAQAFDAMIGRIRSDVETLEIRVKERTSELEQVNVRLLGAMHERERSQIALSDAEARQRLILDAMPASIAYLDGNLRVRFVNRTWSEWLAIPEERILGKTLDGVIGRDTQVAIIPHLLKARQGGSVSFDHLLTGADGRQRLTLNTIIPQLNRDGRIVGFFVLSQDVTDSRASEQRMREAHRLAAVGQLAGGLAHDFNNLLSVILGNLAAARDKFPQVEGLDSYLEPAQRASHRGADIADRLLAYSRRQPLKEVTVDVRQSVQETVLLLERSLPANIRIALDGVMPDCWVSVDPCQFENMIVNLALNARDAMENGGRLEVHAVERLIADSPEFDELVEPGKYIEISVRDSGAGFSVCALSRAFEPFFTTKKRGSGLGLAMVYGFVKQSRGYIRIESDAAVGSAVTILLPRAQSNVSALPRISTSVGARAWTNHVALLAEGDDDVRRLMLDQLVRLGFSVIEADTGNEAARILEHIESVDLLISDVAMPGMGGFDLARRAQHCHPNAGVVLVSGFSTDAIASRDFIVLRKPWDVAKLCDAIQNAMDNKKNRAEERTGGNSAWNQGNASMS